MQLEIYIKLPSPHIQVQHSTGCEDSICSSLVLKASLSTLVILVYVCLDPCFSHFLTIIAGVDLHFRHESELPVCRTRGLNPRRRGARRGC